VAEFAWLPKIIVLVAASVGAATDLWKYRVYNVLTIPLFFSGLLYHVITGGWPGYMDAFLGALFGFAVLIIPYGLGLMGAGDVKLMAGLGAWLGLPSTIHVFVASALIAGVYAIVLIVLRGKLRESWLTLKLIFYRLALLGVHFGREDLVENLTVDNEHRLRVIPFGAMVPLGIVGAYFWLQWNS
jgi:prepilin peptidase CpaA